MTLGPEVERFRLLLDATFDREGDVVAARNMLAHQKVCGHPWTSMSDLNRMALATADSTRRFEAAIRKIAAKHAIKPRPAPPEMSPFQMLMQLFASGGGCTITTFSPDADADGAPEPVEDS